MHALSHPEGLKVILTPQTLLFLDQKALIRSQPSTISGPGSSPRPCPDPQPTVLASWPQLRQTWHHRDHHQAQEVDVGALTSERPGELGVLVLKLRNRKQQDTEQRRGKCEGKLVGCGHGE